MPIISPTAISPHRIGGKSWSAYWTTQRSDIDSLEHDNTFAQGQLMCSNTSADTNTYLYGFAVVNEVTVVRKGETGSTYTNRGAVTSVDAAYKIRRILSIPVPDVVFVLAYDASNVYHLLKSSDGAGTFAEVLILGDGNGDGGADSADVQMLSSRNLCRLNIATPEGDNQGKLLLGEYNINTARVEGGNDDRVRIMVSSDNGDTWSKLVEWNTNEANQIGHVHAILQDPYTGYVYICTGDANNKAAIIRWDGSANWADNKTPTELNAITGFDVITGAQKHRTVDLLFTEDYMFSFSDVNETNNATGDESGIWRISKDLSTQTRVNNDIFTYDPMHVGWFGAKIDGALVFTTARETATGNGWTELNTIIYTSLDNGVTWIGNTIINCKSVEDTVGAQIKEAFVLNDKIYIANTAGAGYIGTDVLTLSGKWKTGDDPKIIHPVYYIGTWKAAGNDSNNGWSQDTPKLTLANILAASRITIGARVRIAAGTYSSEGIYPIWNANAIPGLGDVVIEGNSKDDTIIERADTGGAAGYLFYLEIARVLSSANSYIKFKNITLRCPYNDSITITNVSAYIIGEDCDLGGTTNANGRLIAAYGGSITLLNRVKMKYPAVTTATAQCIYLSGNAWQLIGKNVIFVNGQYHISINSGNGDSILNVNHLVCSKYAAVGISYPAGIAQPTIKNSIFRSPSASFPIAGTLTITETGVDYNSYDKNTGAVTNGAHCLTVGTDPLFIDEDGEDFRLQNTSPCKHTGIAVEGYDYDFDDREVLDPPSMGAYERK